MNRSLVTSILIVCFGLSSVDAARASEIVNIAPIVVQPYELRAMDQQILEQDRINRDEEIAIRGLIDDNQRLAETASTNQQDATLDQINQILTKYRDALLLRDHGRIEANGQRVSKYHDLIRLTEDVDDMKDAQHLTAMQQILQLKSGVIEDKYRMLSDLKNELVLLNQKLSQKTVNESSYKVDSTQEAKIQMLTQRLAQEDQKIAQYDDILAQKDQQITQLKSQVGLLKTELESKITEENNQGPKDETIKEQEKQIAVLKVQAEDLASKQAVIKTQAEQISTASEQLNDQGAKYADVKARVTDLMNKIQAQGNDLKAKNDSIQWLNQVVAATKEKAKYYQLTAQQDQMSMQQVQGEVGRIKNDFTQHFKDYNQFENAIFALKDQVGRLGLQLTQKDEQVDTLKTQLEGKTTQDNSQQEAITKLKSDLQTIQQRVSTDDRLKLAQQLIDLQQQETALLEEKNKLRVYENALFDQHVNDLFNKIKDLMTNHQVQNENMQSRIDELKGELSQKQEQVDALNTTLKNKIAQEKNQSVLTAQIQDLSAQLQDKENQIAAMNTQIQSGQATQTQVDSLKQELADSQNKAESLKEELDQKNAEAQNTTAMMNDYQTKLESKDSAYNGQFGKIADLNAQLEEKQAELAKIKQEMVDVQALANAKDKDLQSKDLSLSIIQQKSMDEKINEYQQRIDALQASNDTQKQVLRDLKADLALARQQLGGMPSSDEIEFLKTGLSKATLQLKQRDQALLSIKANADEYAKEFKKQSQEFESVKEQLQNAYDDINHRNLDLKYKQMEIVRLKEQAVIKEGDLQDQIKILTQKLDLKGKGFIFKFHGNKVEALQAQLEQANEKIKALKKQMEGIELSTGNDALGIKLKQALDKIDEQGRVINILVQKLEDAGKSVNLAEMTKEQ